MILYRIANFKHAEDLSGTGAKLFGGRWNSIGVPMHYMSANRALAALEVLANKGTLLGSKKLCLTVFEVPDQHIQTIEITTLPQNWRAYPGLPELKKLGDEFIRQGEFLLLKVPSAIIIDEFNYLMNVAHPLAEKAKILEVNLFNFDPRLV
ncbi:MAG: RES family NAD+ phosphorylase [Bacteroidota bacterium]